MRNRHAKDITCTILLAALAVSAATAATAQDGMGDDDGLAATDLDLSGTDLSAIDLSGTDLGGATRLKPIVVEARKFEEPIREVPFSVDALPAEEIEAARIRNTADLVGRVPNFNFADTGLSFANTLNIRGIGSSSALISPSVNYYVDGVPLPARVFDQRFMDVRSIEVLKGPQGTLFGLNSQAGAVVVATQDAVPEFGGEIGVEVGSHGERKLDASVGGAISDRVSARLSGTLYGFDGDIRNIVFDGAGNVVRDDKSVREQYSGAISAKVAAELSDGTDAVLSLRHSRSRERPTTGVWLDDPHFPRNAFAPVPETTTETTGGSLEITHDLGFATLTSLTGISHYELDLEADLLDGFIGGAQTGLPPFAFGAAGANVRRIDETSSQVSQELRLNGEIGDRGQWVAGVSGLYSDLESTTDITSLAMANGAYTGRLKKTNLAAFGEVTVPVGERLRIIGGARYTYERQQFGGTYAGRPGGAPGLAAFAESQESTFGFVTGRAGLSFDLGPELTVYGTIARGEKPGGYLFFNQFASIGIPLTEFKSSGTWSYEAGLKGSPLADWLEMSTAVFLNDTSDEQLFTFNPVAGRFDVQNADTRSYGWELTMTARPTESWHFGAAASLLHAEITSGNALIKGNDVPYAPGFTTSLFAEYRHPLEIARRAGSAFGRAEYQHVGSRQIDPANSRRLDAYNLVNLRAGWESDSFDVYGFVENVFDEGYTTSAYRAGNAAGGGGVFAGIPGSGRALGLGARVRF
ncbi:TonB-dependent receptor [Stappia indica]|uniref:TonB-dependent receptor n=1 Tax=Stappia indica TaxID=538381 RepID=A0A857CCB9_9HYPH|nr:TonB-dependent receptor [Stappia indica]QGZ36644.1 TonB-dependent receptor [Stappia indica]